MSPSTSAVTDPKVAAYYDNRRPDLVEMLPRPIGRALDVGCGAGAVAGQLREEGAERIVGIEPDPVSAASAEGVCDQVLATTVESALDELDGPFDTILCHDVLEHLVDPWHVLRRLREIAAPGGRLAHLDPQRATRLARSSTSSSAAPSATGVGTPGQHAPALVHAQGHRRGRRRCRLEHHRRLEQASLGRRVARSIA